MCFNLQTPEAYSGVLRYLQYDRVLILGEFNIHVRCPSCSSFASDFIKLLVYFSLTQYMKHLGHVKGHTLDPVLSHVFCVHDVNLADFALLGSIPLS